MREARSLPVLLKGALLALGVVASVLWSGAAKAEPRVALVIGNSNYGGDLGVLPNPVNDSKLMAATLKKVGFDVVEVEDADQEAMKKAIVAFGDKLSTAGAGATGLFFYAGHGLQVDGGNYLIPIHALIRKPADVDVEAVPIDLVLKQMDFAQSAVNIVILDACRNNPLADSSRGISRGLAEIKTKPVGSFISYSTSPGEVAEDGNGANSPYTAALATQILRPGLDLAEVFRNVRKEVLKATNSKQVPWDSWSLTDPYYFIPPSANPGAPNAAPAAAVDPKQLDLTFWESIKHSTDPADYQAYLIQFPDGVYAGLAANRLKDLGGTKTAENDRAVATGPAPIFVAEDRDIFTKDKTPIYAAPDPAAEVITHAIGGLAVRAAGQSQDGTWWQLHLPNGRIAYARVADMSEQPPLPAEPAPAPASTDEANATPDAPPVDPVAKQYSDLGQALLDQGDIKGAHDAFDKAVTRDPKDPQAVLHRGQASLALGDLDPAVKDFDAAIALDPHALAAYGGKMLARLDGGDAIGAADAAHDAEQVEPTFWSVSAVAAYYFAGKLPEAEAMAARVVQDSPDNGDSWIWQALVLKAEGRDGEAGDQLAASIDNIGNRDWPVPVIEWMQGKRAPERLLVAAKNGDAAAALKQTAEANFYLGADAEAKGDHAGAAKYLNQALAAKQPDLLGYAAAKALLAKIAQP